MLANSMEPTLSTECQRKQEVNENKTETTENASDRESSIESFHTNKSELSITTETELIDVDDIELSDEESWLYKSPKKLTSDEKNASTEKWLEKSIDDMDDIELRATRTALLSKLNQLKLLNSSIMEKEANDARTSNESNSDEKKLASSSKTDESSVSDKSHSVSTAENSISSSIGRESKDSISEQDSWKKSDVFDVVDVQKIAKLQEESLKQSTYKFLSQAVGKKALSIKDLSPASPAQIVSLNKPASIEALNTYTDKMNPSNVYSLVPLHGMKKQGMFSSSSALNCNQELHRGSLPNINKGYYSLKSKKSKRPSEPKFSCPLPIHPSHSKISMNGTLSQASHDSHTKSAAPSYDHRETRTLPSSYRVHSRSNSSSRRDINALSPSPRRESMPFLANNSMEPNFRDNHRKYSSPTIHPRYTTSSATVSPTKSFNSQTSIKSPPGMEYHRTASHSPSRRLPLSTVQHQSPKKGNIHSFPKNGEIRTLKMPSKIPGPALRSGIPVPSTASRASEDDTWSQDCF